MIFDRYRFNEQVAMELGEKILLAIVALIVTWLIARAAKWAFAKLVDAVDFFKRGTGSGQSLQLSQGLLHLTDILIAYRTVFNKCTVPGGYLRQRP